MDSLAELLEDELKDIYSAEHQLMTALSRMARKASSDALRNAFLSHIQNSRNQIRRLDEIARELDIKLTTTTCHAVGKLLEEGNEIVQNDSRGASGDAVLFDAAQRVEQYKIAAYDTARAMAEALEYTRVALLLQQAFYEEDAADRKLGDSADNEAFTGSLAIGDAVVQ